MKLHDVIARLALECQKAGNQKTWAKAHGLSCAYVSDVLRGDRGVGPKLLEALELEAITDYRPVRKKP